MSNNGRLWAEHEWRLMSKYGEKEKWEEMPSIGLLNWKQKCQMEEKLAFIHMKPEEYNKYKYNLEGSKLMAIVAEQKYLWSIE